MRIIALQPTSYTIFLVPWKIKQRNKIWYLILFCWFKVQIKEMAQLGRGIFFTSQFPNCSTNKMVYRKQRQKYVVMLQIKFVSSKPKLKRTPVRIASQLCFLFISEANESCNFSGNEWQAYLVMKVNEKQKTSQLDCPIGWHCGRGNNQNLQDQGRNLTSKGNRKGTRRNEWEK